MLALISILALAADPISDAGMKELKALEGEWYLERLDAEGRMNLINPNDPANRPVITIKGADWKISNNDQKIGVTLIDPTVTPKLIDLKIPDGDAKPNLREGIYRVEEDRLFICLYVGGAKERPANFDRAGSDQTVQAVLVRKKD